MLSRYLKKTLVFSVVAVGIFMFVLSCDNPFSTSLGAKVDVEWPTISVESPVSGAYLKDVATFTGVATAYRELRNVEIKVFNPNENVKKPLLDWTPLASTKIGGTLKGGAKEKDFSFPLDTLNFTYTDEQGNLRTGLEDGFLKIQLRAIDSSNLVRETVDLIYIIKNTYSKVKMTAPDEERLFTEAGELNLTSPATISTGADLIGNIVDRRGIKPGYPMIKFWPEKLAATNPDRIDPATGEPFDDDPQWGWAQLFLSGIDDAEMDTGFYANRQARAVVNSGSFIFGLYEYTINETTRRIEYDRSFGDPTPLQTGTYRFRIAVRDTFFYTAEEVREEARKPNPNANVKYLFPRNPKTSEGEQEAFGFYPSETTAYAVELVSKGERPKIELNNDDIGTEQALQAMEPHIYITPTSTEKIVVSPVNPALKDFRLRILASHLTNQITKATLQWEHTGVQFRSGDLEWDGDGVWKTAANPVDGKIFTFTAFNGMTYEDGGGTPQPIFTGSTEPYTLIVMAYTENDEPAVQRYTLYLDGSGPEVNVRSIRGAFSNPEGDAKSDVGGSINEYPYTVNGNIQVSIDRSASRGIKTVDRGHDKPDAVVKWIIEQDIVDTNGDSTYFNRTLNPNTVYARLLQYRSNPTARGTNASDDFLLFFNNLPSNATSGWVEPAADVGIFPEDRTPNFKLNVSPWDGKDVWLFVIAQDGVYNLGYTAQKLRVDEGTDKPLLNIANLGATGVPQNVGTSANPEYVTVNGPDDLYINIDATANPKPLRARVNVLNQNQGIELDFSDDDGILPGSGVVINLTSYNTPTVIGTGRVSATGMINSAEVKREWNGILSQKLMARALYDNPATPNVDESPEYLPDGVYKITINITDDVGYKVSGAGLPTPQPAATGERTIYFAVHSQMPSITVINPSEQTSKQQEGGTDIWGTVNSRLKIRKLDITFTPDVINKAAGSTTVPITLYTNATYATAATFSNVTPINGDYIYYWKTTVDFANVPTGYTSDDRVFNVRTWDGLGEQSVATRNVQIDNTPPTVSLVAFNFDRLDYNGNNIVNGKVPIEIDAFDLNGIRKDGDGANDRVYIKWFVLSEAGYPTLTAINNVLTIGKGDNDWVTKTVTAGSRCGDFKNSDNKTAGRYWIVLDTTTMNEGFYYLYAVAKDTANNHSNDKTDAIRLSDFTITHNSDRPLIREQVPSDSDTSVVGGGNLKLTGSIYDDDGFNDTNKNTYVQIRFPVRRNGATNNWNLPDNNNTAAAGWEEVTAKINDAGYLEYEFDGTGHAYFARDGLKEYQLRVKDEVERGPREGSGFNPEGKNPDKWNAKGELIDSLPGNFNNIPAQDIVLPAIVPPATTRGSFKFFLKNTDPQVFFNNYDPNEIHPKYSATRPVFSTFTLLRNALGGTIEEISLRDVSFTYGTGTKQELTGTTYLSDNGIVNGVHTYTWAVNPAWLPTETQWNNAATTPDGGYSITIRATDTIGNFTIAEWSFSKDTTGPKITFENISDAKDGGGNFTTVRTISGAANEVAINGQFTDDYSDIAGSFSYQFDNSGTWLTGTVQSTSAGKSWSVPIPSTILDGQHTFSIRVADDLWQTGMTTNITTIANVPFIVDRALPVVIAAGKMRVKGTGLVNIDGSAWTEKTLTEKERIFSAASMTSTSTAKVFTLTGMVYEHNLDVLNISIRNGSTARVSGTLSGINAHAVSWQKAPATYTGWHDNRTTTTPDNSTIRIRRAVAGDMTTFNETVSETPPQNYRYVWELDIREQDFYELVRLDTTPPGTASEDARRIISVIAHDTAGNKSAEEPWEFKLDTTQPVIVFSNLTAGSNTLLESTTINLEGTAEDRNNIRQIQYKIEKYTHSTGVWAIVGTEWRTWQTYTSADAASLVSWKINHADFNGEGYYRIYIRASDWSLSASSGGNVVTSSSAAFYVDRTEPVVTGLTTTQNFFRWNNTNQIVFNLTVADINTLDITGVNTSGGALRGYVRKFGDTNNTDVGSVTITPTNPNSNPASLAVVINKTGTTPITADDRYTLTLVIKDKAGKQASSGNTLTFFLDNAAPVIGMDGVNATGTVTTINAAITGRVQFRPSFTKTSPNSPVSRVAYKIHSDPVVIADVTNTDGSAKSDTDLNAAGWRFDAAPSNPKLIWDKGTPSLTDDVDLAQINNGIAVASILIPDTRNLVDARNATTGGLLTVLGAVQDAPSEVRFNGNAISGLSGIFREVYPLTLHLLAIDEAKNITVHTYKYWVYPAGDYPQMGLITNPDENAIEINRQLNGRIRLAGSAVDNSRIQKVWFRVLNETNTPMTNLVVPEWDDFWNAKTNTAGEPINQTPQNKGGTTISNNPGGWYIANGGGSANVSWWAYINTEGELDPQGAATDRKITIEAMAEDTIWVDSMNSGTGGYKADGWLSTPKSVGALVVSNAPRFEEERLTRGTSSATPDIDTWGSILTTSLKGIGAYSVTVKHNSGIGAIRWTNAPNSADTSVNLVPAEGIVAPTLTSTGIAVKAGPKKPLTAIVNGSTYMIWNKFTGSGTPTGVPFAVTSAENQRYTVFTANANNSAVPGATLLERQADGTFEWVVIVDIDSTSLTDSAGNFDNKARYYTVELSAAETSKSVPLTSRMSARIPIDNLPPSGMYTHSTNVAGTAPTFGGEAGDTVGDVRGLSRVVLWFSRSGNAIVWNELAAGANTSFNNHTGTTATVDVYNGTIGSVALPRIPAENLASNNSCIVIDRNDPLGNVTHHGHRLAMGFAKSGGALDTSWYVALDSTKMISGQVTAHYIVYDKAGNGTYYNQKLMILNGIPKISRITLATAIYGEDAQTPVKLQSGLVDNNGDTAGYNLTFGSGTNLVTTANNTINASAMDAIRGKYTSGLTDAQRGISEAIPIDTTKPGIYNVVYDEKDFMVRNKMLAIKVETDIPQSTTAKMRNYRVEYVSNVTPMAGRTVLTAANGIREGRVYIINDPGSTTNRFPWGTLGAQAVDGNYQRGLVFMALVNGADIDLVAGENYGNPSVWELNSAYYSGNTLTRSNVYGDLRFANTAATTNGTSADVQYTGATSGGTSAEFVYRAKAFANDNNHIKDFTAFRDTVLGKPLGYPASASTTPDLAHSLFIIKIFDGDETDLFGDFALLSIRVNNNDVTPPFAQLYDLNPKAEGTETIQTQAQALEPGSMGNNRTKGGLYNTGTVANVAKSGHIEPRAGASLTGPQMGGAAGSGSITRPAATPTVSNTRAYFEVDTVSGDVIVRGYAEDNQRVARVDLEFWSTANTPAIQGAPVTILTRDVAPANLAMLQPATGLTDRVKFTETVELNRHRVEWAYVWKSEELPLSGGNPLVVGNINVRAVAYNAHSTVTGTNANTAPTRETTEGTKQYTSHLRTHAANMTNSNTHDEFNPSFPVSGTKDANAPGSYLRYNQIRVNIRPYITGFMRNQAEFSHNTRSRQGRYMFARGEVVAVSGFNLGNAANNTQVTSIILPGTGTNRVSVANIAYPTAGVQTSHGLASTNGSRYRYFTVPATAASGTGLVTMTVNNYSMVNTALQSTNETAASIRPATTANNISRPLAIQPWNKEYNASKEGSDLWDDFIMVHIWQSNDTNTDADQGRFKKGGTNGNPMLIEFPSMSIDPATGTLWESHNEGGGGGNNTGTTKTSNNNDATAAQIVAQFIDPIVDSDISISTRTSGPTNNLAYTVWTSYSIIGRAGDSSQANAWRDMGGLYISGPQGSKSITSPGQHSAGAAVAGTTNNGFNTGELSGRSQYIAESTIYNGGYNNPNLTITLPPGSKRADPLSLNQFRNSHIATYYGNGGSGTSYEHIHVAYYDTMTKSIKYRYNRRNDPGVVYGNGATSGNPAAMNLANIPAYAWTNLDGGWDQEDTRALETNNINNAPFDTIVANRRVVGYNNPTTNGFPAAFRNATLTGTATNDYALRNDTGEYNAIAVDRNGYPVIAYYDATQQRLKLAVSRAVNPYLASNWTIRDFVIPEGNELASGTGQYVSLKIDTSGSNNIVHIAAMNATSKQVVYIRGTLNPTSGTTGNNGLYQSTGGVLTNVTVSAVDTVGSVGAWCKISLDSAGNPWIAYQDETWVGTRDGVKVAFLNTTAFYKGGAGTTFAGEDMDVHGNNITGWEAMHVPTQYRVRNTRLGMENFPTRNVTTTATKFWKGAVGYLSDDYYRIAYYVE